MTRASARGGAFTLAEGDRKKLVNLLGEGEATEQFIQDAERHIAIYRRFNLLEKENPSRKELYEQLERIQGKAAELSELLSDTPNMTASQIRQGAYLSDRCSEIPDLMEIERQLDDLALATGEIMKYTKPRKGRPTAGAGQDLIHGLKISFCNLFSCKLSDIERRHFLPTMQIVLPAAGIHNGIPDKVKKALKKMGGKK